LAAFEVGGQPATTVRFTTLGGLAIRGWKKMKAAFNLLGCSKNGSL
jgi:hypothetical protein